MIFPHSSIEVNIAFSTAFSYRLSPHYTQEECTQGKEGPKYFWRITPNWIGASFGQIMHSIRGMGEFRCWI